MSRDSRIFKEGYNQALSLVSGLTRDAELPTESALSRDLGVSRTTVRSILTTLHDAGIIVWDGRKKTVKRAPRAAEYFSENETASASERLSSQFMEYILTGDLEPGAALHESELMKQFGVSSSVLREFLIRFSRFGLIEKEPNRHWVLRGFTLEFAEELFEVREMFERRAFDRFLEAPRGAPHEALSALRAPHEAILANIDRDYLLFPRLDEEMHRIWVQAHGNRFFLDFFEMISLVFHYHYRWNRRDEKERNYDATLEHLAIIGAVEQGDHAGAREAFGKHLARARSTMIASARLAKQPAGQS